MNERSELRGPQRLEQHLCGNKAAIFEEIQLVTDRVPLQRGRLLRGWQKNVVSTQNPSGLTLTWPVGGHREPPSCLKGTNASEEKRRQRRQRAWERAGNGRHRFHRSLLTTSTFHHGEYVC
ncbi:hypothetical protein NDU88_004267 [Pleurodeles waltl]|uniref:Uncharacterized protein n=1 Tax=Pleurodeles waltl TaxID=8319 RepID=A0AAV7MDK8_PLEWA|nr:hypothetical protein NDU88_004267 [Pleurodeles waltl]